MEGGRQERTLFTKSNLAKLVGPILPNPVSNTSSHNNRYRNSEEDTHSTGTMFLVEFVFVARARMGNADIESLPAFAGGDGNAAVAGRVVIFFDGEVFGTNERVVWWCVAFDEVAGAVGSALVIEVTVSVS